MVAFAPSRCPRLVLSAAVCLALSCGRSGDEGDAPSTPEAPPPPAESPVAVEAPPKESPAAPAPAATLPVDDPAGLVMPAHPSNEFPNFTVPSSIADVKALGLSSDAGAPIIVVSNTHALLAALGDDVTIVLVPGTYRFPVGGVRPSPGPEHYDEGWIQKIHSVNFVGLGTPPPLLVQEDTGLAVLGLFETRAVTLYNLALVHEGACSAAALETSDSPLTSVIGVDLSGSGERGVFARDGGDLLIRHSRIHDCNAGLVTLENAGARIVDTTIDANTDIFDGFSLWESSLALENTKILGNRLAARRDAALFDLYPEVDGREPSGKRSEVLLVDSELRDNAFTVLATSMTGVEIEDTRIEHGQFREDVGDWDDQWWCGCQRTRDPAAYELVTRCFPNRSACTTFQSEVVTGKDASTLPAGIVHACRYVRAEKPADALGGTFTRAGKIWTATGGCRLPPPNLPAGTKPGVGSAAVLRAPSTRAASRAASVPWSTLAPIRGVLPGETTVSVLVEVEDDKARELFWEASAKGVDLEVSASDKRVPAEVRRVTPPVLVSDAGATPLAGIDSVSLADSAMGSYWLLEHAIPSKTSLDPPVLAVNATPDPTAKFRRVADPVKRRLDHWAVSLARRLVEGDPVYAPAYVDPGWTVQVAEGRFPAGASHVVAASAEVEGGDGAVFTVDPRGRVVQLVAAPNASVRIDGLVDLDGDGFDEVYVTAAGIEDIDQTLVRLREDSAETISLFSFGH